jgi:hypothetical protein
MIGMVMGNLVKHAGDDSGGGSESRPSDATSDPAKIMYDALVRIAHRDAFFDSEKKLVKIAREAIERVTRVTQARR